MQLTAEEIKSLSDQNNMSDYTYNKSMLQIFGNNYIILTNGVVTVNGILTKLPAVSDSANWEDAKNENLLVNFIVSKLDSLMNSEMVQAVQYGTGSLPEPKYKLDSATGSVYNGNSHLNFSLNLVIPNKMNTNGKIVGRAGSLDYFSSGYDLQKVLANYGGLAHGSEYSIGRDLGSKVESMNKSVIDISHIIFNTMETFKDNKGGFFDSLAAAGKNIYDSTVKNNGTFGGNDNERVAQNNFDKQFAGSYLWYMYLMMGIFKLPFVVVIKKWKIQHSNEEFKIVDRYYSSYTTLDLEVSCDRILTQDQFISKMTH